MHPMKDRGDQLRFGIIGAGRIAESYAQAFQSARNAKLVAVADTRPEVARLAADKLHCAHFDSHLAMADSGTVDAVVVATPPATHSAICLDFLDRKIPVLCEKPVSIDPESARLVCARARETKTAFTMASKFRYAEDVVRASQIIHSGILGEILLFENVFMSYVDMTGRWNADPAVSGGGVLIDNGTHSVDIMRYFIGPISAIHAVSGIQMQNLEVEDTVHVTARTLSGAIGRLDLSWSVTKQCDDYLAVYGAEGTVRVGWRASYYRQKGSSSWIKFGSGYNKVQAFQHQIENFSAAVQGRERLLIEAADAIASVDAIRAGYQALERGTWVDVIHSEIPLALHAA
jgi:predicted dehydrogenase